MSRMCLASAIVVLVVALNGAAQPEPSWGLANLAQTKDAISKRASSSDPHWAEAGNGDARPIQPGATLVLADLAGPGVINHIWFTIASNEENYSRLLALRMFWDDETNPSVESPIGDFFAMGHGIDKPLESMPVSVTSEGRARNCYWPMPFGKRARIEVTNEGTQPVGAFYYYIDWEQVESLPENTAYFHAMYRQEYPARVDSRYMYADIAGRGHYVGTVHSARARTASWIGEGDDFFYIDGEKEPSLKGTGTEDYYCDAWGFHEMTRPFYGAPLFEGYEAGHRSTVYRWHITDPIRFSKSLYAEIEHVGPNGIAPDGSFNKDYGTRLDDIASVAFWYQHEPHKAWEPMPVGHARLYPADLATAYLQSDTYPPYIKFALQMMLQEDGSTNMVVTANEQREFTLEARNPSQLPLAIDFDFQGGAMTIPGNPGRHVEIAPGATLPVRLALTTDPEPPLSDLAPVRIIATSSFDHPAGAVTMPLERFLIFSADRPVAQAASPVTIDGALAEWGELPRSVTQPAQFTMDASGWQGPRDCQWRFGVSRDDAFVYVAAAVEDDHLVLRANEVPWLQDGIEIRVTALPDSERNEYKGEGEFERSLLFAMSPDVGGESAHVVSPEKLPQGAKYACVKTDKGFNAEIAIPAAWLDAQQGKPWEALRINIAIDDRDGNQQTQLWWCPDWRTADTFAGSGTFIRG